MSIPKLLVVDDCQSVRIKVSRILTDAGYDVITATDGLEAIEKMKEQPSLIVLDVNMPGLDGYGVCERLRDLDSNHQDLPIVFLTSLETRALELLGREFGAYLNKPVCEQRLLDVVEQQLAHST